MIIIVTCETEVKMQNTHFYSLANLFRGDVVVKGVVLMSTYEEFMVLLTIGLLIVAILNLKNKK